MVSPMQKAVDFATSSAITKFLIPVGAVIVVGIIVFAVLSQQRKQGRYPR